MFEINGKYTKANIMAEDVEANCYSQIFSIINHSAFSNLVAIMPDSHAGKGSVIGFTMPLSDKIIPNVVGVDISCGMYSVNFGNISYEFDRMDEYIRKNVPLGRDVNEKALLNFSEQFLFWHKANELVIKFTEQYNKKFNTNYKSAECYDFSWFENKCKKIHCDTRRVIDAIGSLGGGNHFIEFGRSDKTGNLWLTVHSGSRNFGKRVCEYWQTVAFKDRQYARNILFKEKLETLRKEYSKKELELEIRKLREEIGFGKPSILDWLEKEHAFKYCCDMIFAQMYASLNRKFIVRTIKEFSKDFKETIKEIETIHNYIDFNDLVIRKGAIRSYYGEEMVIPLNMRDGILLCTGKSNKEWNYSAPHGAGRIMSRSEAKSKLSMKEFKEQMKEIYSTSVCGKTIDEAPNAYKDSNMIKAAIEPTADIIDIIKPIHNIKATSEE